MKPLEDRNFKDLFNEIAATLLVLHNRYADRDEYLMDLESHVAEAQSAIDDVSRQLSGLRDIITDMTI